MAPGKPQTVVFVESAASMGGVQFSTLYLVRALDRSRWKSIVVCPAEGDLATACRDAGVETYVIPYPRLWSTSVRIGRKMRLPNPFAWVWDALVIIHAARRLKSFLRMATPAMVVTKGLMSHFLGGFSARRLGIPCLWHVQDFISERNFGIYRRIFSLAARWLPQQIIVDGAPIARQLPTALTSRVSVIHNGVDTDLFRPGLDGAGMRRELDIPENHLVIGHAARITPWKGQHYLIEAFARIANERPNVSLLIVGAPVFDNDLYYRRLITLAAAHGLQDRIKFAGYRHHLPNALAAMDVFAFTSQEKDTSPLALLSAMSCGLPIVAFDIEGVKELVNHDDFLLLVPVGDKIELASALEKLIGDPQLRSRLAHSARRAVMSRFSVSQYATRVQTVLTSATQISQDPAGNTPEKKQNDVLSSVISV
jgi:glycosyltransferase involved in cell wall biosynthesis